MNVKRIFIICEDKGKQTNCKSCPFQLLKELPRLRAEKILGIPIPWYESAIDIQCFATEKELAQIYLQLAELRGEAK